MAKTLPSIPPPSFVDSPVVASFSVDTEKRIIRGLALPYNAEAVKDGKRWAFCQGSLDIPADVSRVKLLIGHDFAQAVGVITELEDTPLGLKFAARVATGSAGDQALTMAAEGVWDGVSVGLGEGGKFRFSQGVNRAVGGIPLREISICPIPAFTDARVTSVAASAQPKELHMSENTETEAPEFSATIAEAIKAGLSEGFAAEAARQAKEVIPPREVIPAGRVESVREALPYRFDGLAAEHCFTSDLVAAKTMADGAAAQRLEAFLGEAFAEVATTDVATLNPVQNRPELYVGNLHYARPLWNLCTTGGLDSVTAQVLPKFGSISGLVGPHTEGVEPDSGDMTTTSQTITPAAVSGKVTINREVIDQGGNPRVDQIIWTEMVQAYYESVEKKIAAALQAVSTTEVNLQGATATSDEALLKALKAKFAALQFIRGGDRYSAFASADDLYTALVNAEDNDGRPLLPILGPTNADGSVRASLQSVQVGAKTVVPAWPLAALGAAKRSFLFVPSSVYAWASAPRQMNFDNKTAQVEIAIWGYSVAAVTRDSDVIPFDMTTADA